jgi:hypothetical protein
MALLTFWRVFLRSIDRLTSRTAGEEKETVSDKGAVARLQMCD